jgi:hypothetical protein
MLILQKGGFEIMKAVHMKGVTPCSQVEDRRPFGRTYSTVKVDGSTKMEAVCSTGLHGVTASPNVTKPHTQLGLSLVNLVCWLG